MANNVAQTPLDFAWFQQYWHSLPGDQVFYTSSEQTFTRAQVLAQAQQCSLPEIQHGYVYLECRHQWQDWTHIMAAWLKGLCPVLLHHYLTPEQRASLKSVPLPNSPHHLAIATSGTNGAPKLIFLRFDDLYWSARAVLDFFKLTNKDQWNWQLPISHIGGLSIFFRACIDGPCVVSGPLAPGQIVSWVPAQLAKALQQSEREQLQKLKLILIGGSAITSELWREATDLGLPLSLSYGMTESAALLAASTIAKAYPGAAVPAMSVLPSRRLKIDADQRLWVSEILTPATDINSIQYFQTNDLAAFNDQGELTVLGRSDRTIISGGLNIPLAAIEEGLSELGSSIAIGVDDTKWGQTPVVFLWPKNSDCQQERIQQLLTDKLPRPYWPRAIYNMSSLPIHGKFSREQLLACIQQVPSIFQRPS